VPLLNAIGGWPHIELKLLVFVVISNTPVIVFYNSGIIAWIKENVFFRFPAVHGPIPLND
jgi:hypothetical protein